MDEFFLRSVLAGIGVALLAGPLGCIVVWRRMAYFGEALAHSALLGVGLGFMLDVNPSLAILVFCVLMAVLLVMMERSKMVSTDTLLGYISHAALALGLLVTASLETIRVDLMGYLFGDVLAVTWTEVSEIYILGVLVLGILAWIWRALLSLTVNEELAAVEGVAVERTKLIYVLLVAGVIAVGMKVIGILLIISMLIMPAAAARRISNTPEGMAMMAALLGVVSVISGMWMSWEWDLAAGPAIVVSASVLFILGLLIPKK